MSPLSEPLFFQEQKETFEKKLLESIFALCEKNTLRDACEYALMNGGKRFRPLIVESIGNALGGGEQVTKAAIAIEYFHTASLIADDLPCMDNDPFRRNKPSLHVVFGETIALLASYALISEAYKKIHEACESISRQALQFSPLSAEICFKALEVASDSSGLKGATLGQFYDLFPRSDTLNHLEKIIELKTITLFRSAFCFGWLFGGGGMDRLEMVSDLSYHFGLAFQVMDDLLDIDQDLENQNHKNFAIVLGKERAIELVEGEVSLFQEMARSLGIYTPEISLMTDMLLSYAFASSKTRA